MTEHITINGINIKVPIEINPNIRFELQDIYQILNKLGLTIIDDDFGKIAARLIAGKNHKEIIAKLAKHFKFVQKKKPQSEFKNHEMMILNYNKLYTTIVTKTSDDIRQFPISIAVNQSPWNISKYNLTTVKNRPSIRPQLEKNIVDLTSNKEAYEKTITRLVDQTNSMKHIPVYAHLQLRKQTDAQLEIFQMQSAPNQMFPWNDNFKTYDSIENIPKPLQQYMMNFL